jgi:hypothetical protein
MSETNGAILRFVFIVLLATGSFQNISLVNFFSGAGLRC